jgi:hypothetical protein
MEKAAISARRRQLTDGSLRRQPNGEIYCSSFHAQLPRWALIPSSLARCIHNLVTGAHLTPRKKKLCRPLDGVQSQQGKHITSGIAQMKASDASHLNVQVE